MHKHLPSLDELVPACGELVYAITRPPSLEDAPEIFGAHSLEERLERLVAELFDFYERGLHISRWTSAFSDFKSFAERGSPNE